MLGAYVLTLVILVFEGVPNLCSPCVVNLILQDEVDSVDLKYLIHKTDCKKTIFGLNFQMYCHCIFDVNIWHIYLPLTTFLKLQFAKDIRSIQIHFCLAIQTQKYSDFCQISD